MSFGYLMSYDGGDVIRPATSHELRESLIASLYDGGSGAFRLDDNTVYVTGESADARAVALKLPIELVSKWSPDWDTKEIIEKELFYQNNR